MMRRKKKTAILADLFPMLEGREEIISGLSCCPLTSDDSADCGFCMYNGKPRCMQQLRQDIADLIGAELKQGVKPY